MKVRINGEVRELPDGATVADAVRAFGVSDRRGVAVAVDGEVVPGSVWEERSVPDKGELEILRAVQGGAA